MTRLYRAFGWDDTATATLAATLYAFMSVAFAVMGTLVGRAQAAAMGPVRLSLFATLLLVHTVLHWFALRLTAEGSRSQGKRIAYCVGQAALIFAITLLTARQDLMLGLYVTLLAETAALLYPDWRAMTLSSTLFVGLLAVNTFLVWGLPALVRSLPTTGLLFGGIVLYALVLVREGSSRREAQTLVRELEAAKGRLQEYADQVEELTISQERQRMAREMHDTLAQGLAGVILQLEAADAHLEHDRPAEARVIVELAAQRARQTLHESRRAIQALRSPALEQKDLAGALAAVAADFESASGVSVDLVVDGDAARVGPDVAQDVLRIVQEGLSNVRRHAQARHVKIELVQRDHRMRLVLQDDGRGFDLEQAMQRPECFGLQGMAERASRIGAALRVESIPQRGTTLALTFEGTPGAGPDAATLGLPADGRVSAVGEEPLR
jgi:NarL family two-component system sensor histidine kinase YdfH